MDGTTLVLDEPWSFLNARGNPVKGRKLTYEMADGYLFEVDVSHKEYNSPEIVRSKVSEAISAREAIQNM